MTRPRDRRLPSTRTEEEIRLLTRPTELPPQPWRYTITPKLVDSLTHNADSAGPEARAKRMRILWVVGWS